MTATGWQEVRAEVLRRIHARDWPPGALIPTEAELATGFGCARATVNRALRDLAGAGVLERRRKAGTRVATLPVRKATLAIPVIRLEVEAQGQTYAHHLLSRETLGLPLPLASRLGRAEGERMLYLETLHLADGAPFAVESRWLNTAILPPLPDFLSVSVNEWLVASVAYATGEIAFFAQAATEREATALGVPAGTALFITERVTRNASGPITHVRLAHAPGYRMKTQI